MPKRTKDPDQDLGDGTNEPVTAARLKSYVARIEELDADRKSVMEDIREVYGEAKAEGFTVKILKQVIARRARDPHAVREEDELLDLYEAHLEEVRP